MGGLTLEAYDFQSNVVVDMLDKLSAKFVEEKAALEKAEAEKKTSHQLVMTSLKNQKTAASDVVCGSGIFVLFLLWPL